jgi:hypothetical protein
VAFWRTWLRSTEWGVVGTAAVAWLRATDWHWVRHCKCLSLGMLFHFCPGWTADTLYNYYLSLRVVVLKQRLSQSKMAVYSRALQSQNFIRALLSCEHAHLPSAPGHAGQGTERR